MEARILLPAMARRGETPTSSFAKFGLKISRTNFGRNALLFLGDGSWRHSHSFWPSSVS